MALDFGPTGHGWDYNPERSTAVLFSICLKPEGGGIKTPEKKAKKILGRLKNAFMEACHIGEQDIYDEAFEYAEDDPNDNVLMLRFMSDHGPDELMLNTFSQAAATLGIVEYEKRVSPAKDSGFYINVIQAHLIRRPQ